jgi:hypothetical protein
VKSLVGFAALGAALAFAVFGDGVEDPGGVATPPAVPPAVPPTPEATPVAPIAVDGAGEAGAVVPSDIAMPADPVRPLLEATLGEGNAELSALDVLDRDVERLRRTLESLVGKGQDTRSSLEDIPNFDAELEGVGIASDLASEIRDLYPEVQSLRGELMLLDLRTKRSTAEFHAVGSEVAPPEAPPTPEPLARPLPRSPFPEIEALLHFRAGDREATQAILGVLPSGELRPETRFALGSSLVAARRFEEARDVLAPLVEDEGRATLAAAARRQLVRMDMIESGVVGLDPLLRDQYETPAAIAEAKQRAAEEDGR